MELTYIRKKMNLQPTTLRPYLSSNISSEYGIFFPRYLTIALPDGMPSPNEGLDRHFSDLSPKEQVSEAMKYVAVPHEIRHWHDWFGTLAGVLFYSEYGYLIEAFTHLLHELRGTDIQLPLNMWAEKEDAPPSVVKFVARYRQYEIDQFLIGGSFPGPWEEGPAPDVDYIILEVENFGAEVPAYAVTAEKFLIAEDGHITYQTMHQLIPIGLENIIEGIARQIQNRLILHRYGPKALSLVEDHLRTTDAEDRPIPPYHVTDFMLAKVLKRRGITLSPEKFSSLLMAISDYVLCPKGVSAFKDSIRAIHPGQRYIQAIEQVDASVANTIHYKYPKSDTWCQELIQQAQALGDKPPDTFLEFFNWSIWRNYIAPIAKLRLHYGDQVMTDIDSYIDHLGHFPSPDLLTKSLVLRGMANSTLFQKAWIAWVMASSLMFYMMNTKGLAPCPRYTGPISSYLTSLNLAAPHSNCEIEIEKLNCTLDFEVPDKLPNCVYHRVAEGIGIDKLLFKR